MRRYIIVKDVIRKSSESYEEDFGIYHLMILALAQTFYIPQREAAIFTMNTISQIYGFNAPQRKHLTDALVELEDMGIAEVVSIGDKDRIGYNDAIELKIKTYNVSRGERFAKLNHEFVERIMAADVGLTVKGNAMMVYALLAQYTGGNEHCYPSMATMMEDLGVSKPTIISSLDLLRELDIVIFKNAGMVKNGSETHQSNNCYVFTDVHGARKILNKVTETPNSKIQNNEKIILMADYNS